MLFLPPLDFNGANKLFSGLDVVISSLAKVVIPRRPGVIGLYFLIGINLIFLLIAIFIQEIASSP